jgi:folate-binding protein YgfZ
MSPLLIWNFLESFSALEIRGLEAEAFLQGQFTCDVRLQSGQAIMGACCDHKGRMLVNGWVGKLASDHYLLFIPSGLLVSTLLHLKKFAIFSKIEILENPQWKTLVYCGNVEMAHSDESILKGETAAIHWRFGELSHLNLIAEELAQITPPSSSDALELLLIENKIVFVQTPTQGMFIPQMIGLEKWGGVSFHKGCYVGQEVVARTQHLGQLKRRLQTLRGVCDIAQKPFAGDGILDEQNETMGYVAACAPATSGVFYLLAVIQDRALSQPFYTPTHHRLELLA